MNLFVKQTKKQRIKNAILRDVLDDNLRIIGKKQDRYFRQVRRLNLRLIFAVAILSILFYFFSLHYTFIKSILSGQQGTLVTTGYLNAENTYKSYSIYNFTDQVPGLNPGGSSSTPHYSNFFNIDEIPLRRLFGLKVRKIVIDPGHGGEDNGAKGQMGTKEKHITLDIARRLKKRLEKYSDYQIIMTRTIDRTVLLEDRVKFANSLGADLFISIHVNYIPSKPLSIIETYYFGDHTDEEALELAARENQGTGYSLNEFNKIIKNIGNTLKTQESKSLASYIQYSLVKNMTKQNKEVRNNGIKTAPFIVLLGLKTPSVLAEVACLNNPEEERQLNKPYYREMIACYLEEGIVRYLNKKSKIESLPKQKSKPKKKNKKEM